MSKALTAGRLSDIVLGCFSNVKPSPTVDHLVRYLGTWSGSDKLFMLVQYTLKLVVSFMRFRVRMQQRAGLKPTAESTLAGGYEKLAGIISDSRTLWRMWGLLPIFQWLISLERNPPATRTLLTIERLQGWSMLGYYPLEHLSYLLSHGVIPATFTLPLLRKPVKLDAGKLSLWSTRFWALYVFLHFAHLWEDRKLLIQRQRDLRKSKATGLTTEEKKEFANRWDAYWSEVVANLAYLPQTVHWSLEKGFFNNGIWVDVAGFLAAVSSFRSGWRATALPPPPPPPASTIDEKQGDAAFI
ncbi:hypothetical protein BKA70DRAFT_1384235 [Coprinopsis sp. MPI-PUGE-AT-0042]|nr:hypothetical protein BKA70DRAFT_1384235 [Coprinopsis sp. MPI-PUGE-AT-0042]